MTFIFSTIKIISGIAIFQSILIIFYLFTNKKGTQLRKYVLGILLIAFAVFLSGTVLLLYFNSSSETRSIGHLFNLTIFLTAPLLYLYYKSFAENRLSFNKKELFHFIPFVVITSILAYKMLIHKSTSFVFEPYGIFLISFLLIQNIVYLSVILINYNRNNKISNRGNDKQNWFRFILSSFIILFFVKLVIFIVWNVLEENLVCIYFTNIFFVLSFFIVNTIVLLGLQKPEYLIGHVKYQGSSIDNVDKQKYLELLNKSFLEEQLFVDPLISLNKISNKLKIPSRHLSQVINETYALNFNDYINRLRIEKAIQFFEYDTEKKRNILEIAYEVGFNSKTTFNTAFKKHTGKTPSEFRKQ